MMQVPGADQTSGSDVWVIVVSGGWGNATTVGAFDWTGDSS